MGKGVRVRVWTGVRVGVVIWVRVRIRRTGREVARKRKKVKKIQQKDKMFLFDSK